VIMIADSPGAAQEPRTIFTSTAEQAVVAAVEQPTEVKVGQHTTSMDETPSIFTSPADSAASSAEIQTSQPCFTCPPNTCPPKRRRASKMDIVNGSISRCLSNLNSQLGSLPLELDHNSNLHPALQKGLVNCFVTNLEVSANLSGRGLIVIHHIRIAR
jgi:hypothetical protein